MEIKEKREKRYRRHRRIRAKIFGTVKVPRLCVFRSAKHIYAQLIDDERGRTIAVVSDLEIKKQTRKEKVEKKKEGEKKAMTRKVTLAYKVGKLIAEKALKKKIEKVIFDRASYKYHGRVKALADGAREGGLKF